MKKLKQQDAVKSESVDLSQEHELRVLVVDDDSSMTESYSLLLNACGFESHVCVHGVEAMEMIERLRPHVVLLDLSMPGLDGFGIAEELQHNLDLRPNLLIANTGHSDETHRIKTAAAGFDYHLVKPVHWDDLRTILHDCEKKLRSSLGDEARPAHIKRLCLSGLRPGSRSSSRRFASCRGYFLSWGVASVA